MEGRLGRLMERLKGKKDKDTTARAASTISARDLSPALQDIGGSTEVLRKPLAPRLIFGQRVPTSEIDPLELARIIERRDTPLVIQATLPWDEIPEAEIYALRPFSIARNPALSRLKDRTEADQLRLKEFEEGVGLFSPSRALAPRSIIPPRS